MTHWPLRISILVIALHLHTHINAQAVWDTTRELSRHEGGYASFKAAPRIAIGYNGGMIAEAGYAKSSLSLIWLMNHVTTRYAAVQWTANPHYKHGLWGAKAGLETDFLFLHMGVELLAQTDLKKVKIYFVPNAGLTWFGTVGIYYSWLSPLSKKDFPNTNPYQLMLKYNLTKEMTREFKDGVEF
jgi:hypothetical protein